MKPTFKKIPIPFDEVLEQAENGARYGWLSPEGNYYIVPLEGHEQFMRELYSKNKDWIQYSKKKSIPNFTDFAFTQGWLRIVFYGMSTTIIEFMGSSSGLKSEHIQRLKEATGLRVEMIPYDENRKLKKLPNNMNFKEFYMQAERYDQLELAAAKIKNNKTKITKGPKKGQPRSILKKNKELQLPGNMHYRDANGSHAPSGSTFVAQG